MVNRESKKVIKAILQDKVSKLGKPYTVIELEIEGNIFAMHFLNQAEEALLKYAGLIHPNNPNQTVKQ